MPRDRSLVVLLVAVLLAVPAAPAAAAFPSIDEISSPLTISLPAPAEGSFSTADPIDPGDRQLRAELAERWPQLVFSSQLSRVAEAYAGGSVAVARPELPQRFLHSLLSWAGAVENDAVVITVSTSEESTVDVMNQLDQAIAAHQGQPFNHVGLGRAPLPEKPFRWRWVAVLSRRLIELEHELPRVHEPDTTAPIRFRLLDPLTRPEITVVRPGGDVEELPVDLGDDGWFKAEIATGPLPGTLWLELVAAATTAPVLAAQLPLVVSAESADAVAPVWRGHTTPDESFISTTEDAEQLMFELVNADRARYGLKPLHLDPELTRVAHAHSSDMRSNGFFSHVSPTRGDLQARLDIVGYRAATARENICKAATVFGAEESLLRSPTHRANIFAGDVENIGIGIVIELQAGGDPGYVVTQVFATAMNRPSTEQVRDAVADLVERQRDATAAPPLHRQPKLDRAALTLAAEAAVSGRLEAQAFQQAHRDLSASGMTIRKIQAELLTTNSMGAIKLSEQVFDNDFNAAGIGVAARDDAHGLPVYTVVILLVEMKPGR